MPLGSVELPTTEFATGFLEPAETYAAIQPVLRKASEALLTFGFFGAVRVSATESPDHMLALQQASAMPLELVDEQGELVPATFVNIIEPPDEGPPVVIARLSHAGARVAARHHPQTGRGGHSADPAA